MFRELVLRALVVFRDIELRTRDEDGQTLSEYGLTITLIVTAVLVAAVFVFKDAIAGVFDRGTTCLDGAATSGTC